MNAGLGRRILAAVAVVVATAVAAWVSIRPRSDRTWIVEHAVLPEAVVEGSLVRVRNVRNFAYTARDRFTPGYEDRTYDLDKLVSVWYVLTPFSMDWRGPAHSFVSFGFADSQFVAISVEARREPGEAYGAFAGLFKRFELFYVVGDERDLVGRRAVFDEDRTYVYPIRAKPERMRAMFLAMLERANRLRARPEFYNSLTNNCTSNVIAHVNQIAPKTVSMSFRSILPGYTDAIAFELGLIDTDLDLEAARAKYLVNDRARRFLTDPAFSFRIREVSAPAAPGPPSN